MTRHRHRYATWQLQEQARQQRVLDELERQRLARPATLATPPEGVEIPKNAGKQGPLSRRLLGVRQ